MGKKATTSVKKAAGKKTTGRKKPVPKKGSGPAKKGASVRAAKKSVVGVKKSAALKPIPPKTFSEKELEHFKEIILKRKQEELDELDVLKESIMDTTTGEYVNENSSYSLHMEQGTDAMEREKTFLFASRSSKYVSQLDDALSRIENKSYGICKACQLLVPKERLEVVPTAQSCAEYKNTNIPCEKGKIHLAKMKRQRG